jgi:hypothetical protein
MFLVVDAAAILILGFVQAPLLTFGQMAVVLGLIRTFAFRDIGIVCFVARGLLAVHRAIGQTLIDAALLIVEPLIDLVHAGMIGDGLRHDARSAQYRAAQACKDERFGFDYHDNSFKSSGLSKPNASTFVGARRLIYKPPMPVKNASGAAWLTAGMNTKVAIASHTRQSAYPVRPKP